VQLTEQLNDTIHVWLVAPFTSKVIHFLHFQCTTVNVITLAAFCFIIVFHWAEVFIVSVLLIAGMPVTEQPNAEERFPKKSHIPSDLSLQLLEDYHTAVSAHNAAVTNWLFICKVNKKSPVCACSWLNNFKVFIFFHVLVHFYWLLYFWLVYYRCWYTSVLVSWMHIISVLTNCRSYVQWNSYGI